MGGPVPYTQLRTHVWASADVAGRRPARDVPAPSSTLSVQIGAFGTRAIAQAAWADIKSAAPGLAAGRSLSVEPISAGGTPVYRSMVTGFNDRAQAVHFCEALRAKGKACFVRSE